MTISETAWNGSLLLVLIETELSSCAIGCKCRFALDRLYNATLPMQIPYQPDPMRKKRDRDLHADSRLPSFNSFYRQTSISYNPQNRVL
jgi:hypothetical protein